MNGKILIEIMIIKTIGLTSRRVGIKLFMQVAVSLVGCTDNFN